MKADGLRILGEDPVQPRGGLDLQMDQDHRLAFAAAVLKRAGFAVQIDHPEVVQKSFPEFWDFVGGVNA